MFGQKTTNRKSSSFDHCRVSLFDLSCPGLYRLIPNWFEPELIFELLEKLRGS
jgi:hypothetical protein